MPSTQTAVIPYDSYYTASSMNMPMDKAFEHGGVAHENTFSGDAGFCGEGVGRRLASRETVGQSDSDPGGAIGGPGRSRADGGPVDVGGWAERGSRPRCWRQTEYKWVYLFGAACPSRGEAVGYLMSTAGTFCMNLHLAQISRSVDSDVQVAFVLDGAVEQRAARAGQHHPDSASTLLPGTQPDPLLFEYDCVLH